MKYETAHNGRKVLQPSDHPTIEMAADYLGVTPETVRRWIRQGRLRAYRVGPRLLRVDTDSLDRAVQAQ